MDKQTNKNTSSYKNATQKYILAFDSANEVISIGLGELNSSKNNIVPVQTLEMPAHRASNTQLLPQIDKLMKTAGIKRSQLACVVVGNGPGSFTGVRIALATAKGIASALHVGLISVSTLNAVAWNAWQSGLRGHIQVVADAMRKEVYPALYLLNDLGVQRLSAISVCKADKAATEIKEIVGKCDTLTITGDALTKYRQLFDWADASQIAPEELWTPTGKGLLLAVQSKWQQDKVDPYNHVQHNSGLVLPVYTRLSDAEENERIKLADLKEKNLKTGVQSIDASKLIAEESVVLKPLDRTNVPQIAKLEKALMGSDAWNEHQLAAELPQKTRTWWVASEKDGQIIGYAGGMIAADTLEILKVGVNKQWQNKHIATALVSKVAEDARSLGAKKCCLEVRKSNVAAQKFYQALELEADGVRPRYYSDSEDAILMSGPLPIMSGDVAGMALKAKAATQNAEDHPIIFAIESSCDETAAAISCNGKIVADVVASQVDFHKRFGGVVPEIASRKHIEAICGVCDACFEKAAEALDWPGMSWQDLDAVAVTYAPGLVGALVVGMAFAKGAAWGAQKPFIGVNHLEGHLYANKLASKAEIPLPGVASIVSGGNTILVHVKDWGNYQVLGTTIDDAVGEAFDKVSKALGLGYPGGPIISKLAAQGNPDAIKFPRAMLHSGDLRFSLSGLKTAVITYIQQHSDTLQEQLPDICAGFQQAVIDVQVAKAKTAIKQTHSKSFMFGGGVAANPALRDAYEKMCKDCDVKLIMAPLSACGDNAAMIALVANERYKQGKFFELDKDVQAHLSLDQKY